MLISNRIVFKVFCKFANELWTLSKPFAVCLSINGYCSNSILFVIVDANVILKSNIVQIPILFFSNCYENCSKCFVILFKLIGKMTKQFCSMFKFEKTIQRVLHIVQTQSQKGVLLSEFY